MNVQRGDIVIVDFPYSDRTGSKVRPALVVQADRWNRALDDTILSVISSSHRRMKAAVPTQYFIPISPSTSVVTGLRADSVVQCENLMTLDRSLILTKIGSLDAMTMTQIDQCLNAAFGL